MSLIHIETACLQIRKACEAISFLCVISSEIELDLPSSLRQNRRVGQVIKKLSRQSKLHFPRYARLEKIAEGGEESAQWKLDIRAQTTSEIARFNRIHDRIGNLMHEFSPFDYFPDSRDIRRAMLGELLAIRSDHQWMWNQFWQHANEFRGNMLFVNLGDANKTSRPDIISIEGFLSREISIDFDPDAVSDFTGEVDWKAFEGPPN